MKHDFKNNRRKLLKDNNIPSYRSIVLLYNNILEKKLEENLRIIANRLDIDLE